MMNLDLIEPRATIKIIKALTLMKMESIITFSARHNIVAITTSYGIITGTAI